MANYEDKTAWYDCNPKVPRGSDSAVHAKVFPHVKQIENDQRDVQVVNRLNAKLEYYMDLETNSQVWHPLNPEDEGNLDRYYAPLNIDSLP